MSAAELVGLIDALGRSSLFAGLGRDELDLVLSISRTRRFGSGDVVFSEGEVGEELFLVKEGKVAITKQVKGNIEQVLAHLGPGDYFGEMAVMDKIPRTATATAEEACVLVVIGESDLLKMMDDYPKTAAKIMFNLLRTFSRRLQATNEQVRDAVKWGLEATGYQIEV